MAAVRHAWMFRTAAIVFLLFGLMCAWRYGFTDYRAEQRPYGLAAGALALLVAVYLFRLRRFAIGASAVSAGVVGISAAVAAPNAKGPAILFLAGLAIVCVSYAALCLRFLTRAETPQLEGNKLDPTVVDEIEDFFVEAKNSLARGDTDSAAGYCQQAWQLVPEPKFKWDFSYMFLHQMVTYTRPANRNYDELTKLLEEYIASSYFRDDDYGPYFWLGSLYFERGDMEVAYEYFAKANKMTGGRCFADEDARYKKFFRERRANTG